MKLSHRSRQCLSALLIGLVFVVPAAAVNAQDAVSAIRTGLNRAATGYGPPPEPGAANVIIGKVIGTALTLTGILLLAYLIYGGFVWMTAGGDKGKTEKATLIIRNAVIGILIIALSNVIADYVLTQIQNATSTTSGTGASTAAGP